MQATVLHHSIRSSDTFGGNRFLLGKTASENLCHDAIVWLERPRVNG